MSEKEYDVVIVGAGICGAIAAKVLSKAGKRVLILEAGRATDGGPEGYRSYLDTYYRAAAKTPNSPYPNNPNAPAPSVLSIQQIDRTPTAGQPPASVTESQGYFVQQGPQPFSSNYTRAVGGTTLHWLGTSLRMLRNDFKIKSTYGQGLDWPISYDELRPYYERAEWEIGVSADVEDQIYPGIDKDYFGPDYSYPMRKVPQSYVDQTFIRHLDGATIRYGDKDYPLDVVSTPQGRNSVPIPGYTPVGAVGDPTTGLRCEGNSSCIPICPVQAKYSALKTLASLDRGKVDIVTQAVASKVEVDGDTGRVTGITYKLYQDESSPAYETKVAKGKVFVLAAHAAENATLMLASGVANSSGLVGRHLMDHPYMLTWALMPESVGSFRGPSSTSGIPTLRDGGFRDRRAAFRIEIANWGWNFAAFSPYSDVGALVNGENLFGAELRNKLADTVPRQIRLGFLLEQLPEWSNYVTIDPQYKDQLGNHRPVIRYDISAYTRAGAKAAIAASDKIYEKLGIKQGEEFTSYQPTDAGYLTYEGVGYTMHGSGHLAGTHIMGSSKASSVVDSRQRSWDHDNLYLVGCGNMPTVGTSNPTLTCAALTFWAAENILQDWSRT
jgi:choline dehydrogenase-like flavoprotein